MLFLIVLVRKRVNILTISNTKEGGNKMKKFYTIAITITILLILQMLVTTKAYGETKMTADEVQKYALEQGLDGYVEQVFDSYKELVMQTVGYDEAKAEEVAESFAYLREHGKDINQVWIADNYVGTMTFNDDGTVVVRRYVNTRGE